MQIEYDLAAALGGEDAIAAAVAGFQQALASHALTIGVPAPVAHPIVEQIVRGHGGVFSVMPAPDEAPEVQAPGIPLLTPRQLRLMMLQLGITEQDILDAIGAIEDAGDRAAALIEWQWATVYRRDHPLVVLLAEALEFEPDELDALWIYAADL